MKQDEDIEDLKKKALENAENVEENHRLQIWMDILFLMESALCMKDSY
jgi:hypothetical protein